MLGNYIYQPHSQPNNLSTKPNPNRNPNPRINIPKHCNTHTHTLTPDMIYSACDIWYIVCILYMYVYVRVWLNVLSFCCCCCCCNLIWLSAIRCVTILLSVCSLAWPLYGFSYTTPWSSNCIFPLNTSCWFISSVISLSNPPNPTHSALGLGCTQQQQNWCWFLWESLSESLRMSVIVVACELTVDPKQHHQDSLLTQSKHTHTHNNKSHIYIYTYVKY